MFVVLLFIICYLVVWMLRVKQTSSDPPMMSGWAPIIGHAHRIMGEEVHMLESIIEMTKECENKGGLVTLYLGFRKAYAVLDPEDSLTIMNNCLQKHMFLDFSKPIFGNGLFTADVKTWKTNRKLLNPAFSQRVLNGYIEIFNAQAERLVQGFAQQTGKILDQENLLRTNNLETICTTSLGIYATDPKYTNLIKQYTNRLENLMVILNDRLQKFWLYSDFVFNWTTLKKQQDEVVKHIVDFAKMILQNNRAKRKLANKETESETNKPQPFIELILDLAENTGCFNDDEIEKEIENVIVGGHDTSATILTYALAEVGSNMAVQQKAADEIFRVLGDSGKYIDKDDLGQLQYIEAIIKETLRLHVVLPVLPRYIDTDVKLKKYTLKANTDCFILIHGINRHKGLWGADADQFRPERWLEKDSLPDAKYFAAFGLGKRSCIGKTYAMMSMKISLAHLLRSYEVKSNAEQIVKKMLASIRPVSGHHITLTARTKSL